MNMPRLFDINGLDIYEPSVRRRIDFMIRRSIADKSKEEDEKYATFLLKLMDMHLLRWHRAIMVNEDKDYQTLTRANILNLFNKYMDIVDLPEYLRFEVPKTFTQLEHNKKAVLKSAQEKWEKAFGMKIDSQEYRDIEAKVIKAWSGSGSTNKQLKPLKVISSRVGKST